jgi:Protein of unknown function (DUF1207)
VHAIRAAAAILLGVCLGSGVVHGAQDSPTPSGPGFNHDWLRDRDWFLPLIADPKPPAFTFAFPMWSDPFEFSLEAGRRVTWEVNVGKEIPIFVIDNFTPATALPGRWGLGVWTAVSFHVLEDFKDPSAPIINTDYRFSLATIKFRRVQRAFRRGPNHADYLDIKADLYHHESTHLGDEFVIGAQRTFPETFERINVSYEFWDAAVSYEWRRRRGDTDAYAKYMVRGGILGVLPHSKGYYSDHTLEPESRTIAVSKRNYEPYMQLEYWAPHRNAEGTGWAPFASVDARFKTIYDYRKASADVSEDKQWSTNAMIGFRRDEASALSVKDLYFRFYHGVNPHGQLRNQRNFTTFGVGVSFNIGQARR